MVKKGGKEQFSSVKHTLLAIAIALVAVFFVAYATESFYPSPNYEDFCGERVPTKPGIMNEADCSSGGGRWQNYDEPLPDGSLGWCEEYYTCSQDYQNSRDGYERNVFFVNVILGIVIIVLSFMLSFETVSNGFMGSGILLLFYGSVRYWGDLSNVLRTIMLGIVLAILVGIGYKKLNH